MISLSNAALARVEEKVYGLQVSLSVYIGLVRASLQEKVPLLNKHPFVAIFVALCVVFFVQILILLITLFTKTLAFIWMLPALFGSVLAYVPLVNKWV